MEESHMMRSHFTPLSSFVTLNFILFYLSLFLFIIFILISHFISCKKCLYFTSRAKIYWQSFLIFGEPRTGEKIEALQKGY